MKTIFLIEAKSNFERVYPQEILDFISELDGCVCVCRRKTDILNDKDAFRDTEVIFSTWGMPSFSEDEIRDCFPKLKCLFYAAGTVQHFARPFLKCGVKVFSAWAANAVPVAEYTVAQIILANKGFFGLCKVNGQQAYRDASNIFAHYKGNYKAKIGIIGAGMIGKKVIELLKAYDLDVLVFDPFLAEADAASLGVSKVSLEKLFAQCDVVSNHLANNEATKGMLNGTLFEKMVPNATFLNTGRGAQVVENDLIQALKKRPDITAILDVTFPEPPAEESELYTLPNCILTPHMAGSSGNEVHRMAEYMLREYEDYRKGIPSKYEVTLKMLETMA